MARLRNDLAVYERAGAWWDPDDPVFRPLRALAPARERYLTAIAPDWGGVSALDVGCGGGFMSERLARRGARVIGVDLAAGALGAARAQAARAGLEIAWIQARGDALPLPDASVDRALCTDVLVHVPEPRAVVLEIGRVLRPGGLLFFSSIDRSALSRLVMITLGEDWLRLVHRGTHDPAKFIRPAELRGWLAEAGLRWGGIAGIGPTGWSPRGGLRFGRWPSTGVMYQGWAERI